MSRWIGLHLLSATKSPLTRNVAPLIGIAEPVSDLKEDGDVPAAITSSDAPVNEKGDEPLQHHEEEMHEANEVSREEGGLSWIQKLGALAVIVAVCVVFVRSTSGARRDSSASKGNFEKSLA